MLKVISYFFHAFTNSLSLSLSLSANAERRELDEYAPVKTGHESEGGRGVSGVNRECRSSHLSFLHLIGRNNLVEQIGGSEPLSSLQPYHG